MNDPILTPEAEQASREAVHATRDAAQAVETARAVQMAALNEGTTQALIEALRQVFGENTEKQRFIDVTRIPLICKSIYDIHDNIGEIKKIMKDNDERYVNADQFWPIKTLVYGLVGIMLTGVVGALIALVIKQ